jgi:hypothetical protein
MFLQRDLCCRRARCDGDAGAGRLESLSYGKADAVRSADDQCIHSV